MEINLEQGINSITLVNLYGNCENIINPYFTWQFTNLYDSRTSIVFTTDDNSPNPYYYNTFTISLTQSIGLTSGNVNMSVGPWVYYIYEMSEQYMLSTASAIGLVNQGPVNVIANYPQVPTYTYGAGRTYSVYRRNTI
jgi:hypothetical protein